MTGKSIKPCTSRAAATTADTAQDVASLTWARRACHPTQSAQHQPQPCSAASPSASGRACRAMETARPAHRQLFLDYSWPQDLCPWHGRTRRVIIRTAGAIQAYGLVTPFHPRLGTRIVRDQDGTTRQP